MNQAQAIPQLTPYDQLLALPENQVGEIIGGQLYTQQNRPAGLQIAAAGAAINSILGSYRSTSSGKQAQAAGGFW
jgi:hypothetical protein